MRARLAGHCARSARTAKHNPRFGRWLEELRGLGLRPGMVLLDRADVRTKNAKEMAWIDRYSATVLNIVGVVPMADVPRGTAP